MNVFRTAIAALAHTPAWIPFALLPALLAVAVLLFTLLGGRRAYPPVAASLAAFGALLIVCMGTATEGFCYFVAFAALAALLGLFLLLPKPKRRAPAKRREDRLYERFHAPLDGVPDRASDAPVKECCFEAPPLLPREDMPDATYAHELLAKLRKCKLSATDRLEADVLARTIGGLGARALTAEEARTLNDCLASVLRLTAKYKL